MQEALVFSAIMEKLGEVLKAGIEAHEKGLGMEGININISIGQKAVETLVPVLEAGIKAGVERDRICAQPVKG